MNILPDTGDTRAPTIDLARMTPAEFDAFTAGYLSGYLAADEAAERRNDAHWDALHHEAYETVQAMAKLPTHADLERQRRTYTRPSWATPAPWVETT